MKKTCTKCNVEKELDLFAKGGYKGSRKSICKKCHTEYMVRYYADRPAKRAEKTKMNSSFRPNWSKHGISEEDYKRMLGIHDGKCHSCRERPATDIDHNHECCTKSKSCGKCIRGILCMQCNTALGLLGTSPEKIEKLAKYIKTIG